MMNDQNDYLKKLSAFEQAAAEIRPIANVLATYFTALTENGFNRVEALNLVGMLQSKIFDAAFNNMGPQDNLDADGE